jgi:hypothetical protein
MEQLTQGSPDLVLWTSPRDHLAVLSDMKHAMTNSRIIMGQFHLHQLAFQAMDSGCVEFCEPCPPICRSSVCRRRIGELWFEKALPTASCGPPRSPTQREGQL